MGTTRALCGAFFIALILLFLSGVGGSQPDTGYSAGEDIGQPLVEGYGSSGDFDTEDTRIQDAGADEGFTVSYDYDVGDDFGYGDDSGWGADGSSS